MRQSAAVKIQSAFRSYLIRKQLKKEFAVFIKPFLEANKVPSLILTLQQLQPNEINMTKCIVYNRAATCIQKYWSMYRLRAKLKAFRQI